MAINGFQLSQSQSMDTGSRTKKPNDNRQAMEDHAQIRKDALYGSLDILKESSVSLSDSSERDEKDEDIELPEDNKLLRSSGVRPQYLDNVRKRIHEVKFDINESYLNSTFKS
tara:strand:- start:81 stop:419 length:339 start_codon:yes stop_codon:yes gene_type:complete